VGLMRRHRSVARREPSGVARDCKHTRRESGGDRARHAGGCPPNSTPKSTIRAREFLAAIGNTWWVDLVDGYL
jgi:hypothetical protein